MSVMKYNSQWHDMLANNNKKNISTTQVPKHSLLTQNEIPGSQEFNIYILKKS